MTEPKPPASDHGNKPIPDPTVLSTELVQREIKALRELMEVRMDGKDKALDERLRGMDTATELRQAEMNRVPKDVDIKLAALKDLHSEKFVSIDVQFKERDIRSDQSARDSKVAVDAALQAAKEAVGEQNRSSALAIAKSETATMKQIDQMGILIQTSNAGLSDKIDDVKERLTQLEGQDRGKTDQSKAAMNTASIVSIIIGALLGVAGLFVAVATFILRR